MGLIFNHGDTKCTYQTDVNAVNQLLDTYVKSSQQEVLDLIQLSNNVVIGDITNNTGDVNITVFQTIDSQNIQQADIMIKDILNSDADAGIKLDALMNVVQECSSNKMLDMSKHETDVLNTLNYETLTELTQIIYDQTCITANIGASQNFQIGNVTNNTGDITVYADSAVKVRSEQMVSVVDSYNNETNSTINIDTDYQNVIDTWSKNDSSFPDIFNNILLIIMSPIIIIVLIFLLVIAYNLLVKPLVNKNKSNDMISYPYVTYPNQLNNPYVTYPNQLNNPYVTYPNQLNNPTKQIEYPISSTSKSNSNETISKNTQTTPSNYNNDLI